MERMDVIRRVKQAHEQRLLSLPGVTGVDIGYKIVNGQKTNELVIRIYVEEKKDEDKLPAEQIIPKEIEGVKTDVIQQRFAPFAGQNETIGHSG
jgi:hypothetical protein